MTSKPSRDLGPPLAIAGGGVAVVAVIAGFIIVGGPGDARDQRLDDLTMGRVSNIAAAARCALAIENEIPADLAGLRASIDRVAQRDPDNRRCNIYGSAPIEFDVEYARLADDRIRVCSTFRTAYDPKEQPWDGGRGSRAANFPELHVARPAGRHCYEINLVKPQPAPPRMN